MVTKSHQEILEIELKFIIQNSNSSIFKYLETNENSKELKAYLFDKKTTQDILFRFKNELVAINELNKNLEPFKGRVRSTTKKDKTSYSFDLKGAKDSYYESQGIVAKPEISLDISEKLFKEITKEFPTKFLVKKRSLFKLVLRSTPKIPLYLEVDQYSSINGMKITPSYLIMEIEIPENTDLNPDEICLLYTSPSPRDQRGSRMPSSA